MDSCDMQIYMSPVEMSTQGRLPQLKCQHSGFAVVLTFQLRNIYISMSHSPSCVICILWTFVWLVASSCTWHSSRFWWQVCRTWCRLAADEFLWRDLVYRHWSINPSIPRSPCCSSWRDEYERLWDQCPIIESEVLHSHSDQVLHVSFSHDGQLFATTSKDGFIKVRSWQLIFLESVITSILFVRNMNQ